MITFCLPTKDNLRYLKGCIESIRKNSTYDNEILVWVDSDNDGTIDWLDKNNVKYMVNSDDKPKGIAYGYNRCIESSSKDIVCMFHADMFMGKGFDKNLIKHLKENTVVAGTRIEPPLHPEGKEKIVEALGMYPEDFDEDKFNKVVSDIQTSDKDKTTKGIFAPWICYKKDIIDMGMHDERFHSYHEDSDIFNRFILNGMDIVQSRDSLVYHLTCRGGQFKDGIEKVTDDTDFHLMKTNAFRNYLRKWGSSIFNDEYHYPILQPKYDIGLVIKNCNEQVLGSLEPWCSTIYVDVEINNYLEYETPNTYYDLNKRVYSIHSKKENDIIVRFDATKLTQQGMNFITQLGNIIKDSGELGSMEYDIFEIEIKSMRTYEGDLIKCEY
tara:strand:- start:494 stop:1642 length:1149 start_codon:yes stop_codon:yes gene_type:complete